MDSHRIASIFPAMDAVEFAALKADIAEHGLREPIWTYQGAIIDGIHRERACRELGIDPASREWNGSGSLIGFVVSLNLHRRHLTAGQRAIVAVAIEPELAEEARKRQSTSTGGSMPQLVERIPQAAPRARDEAARMAGVNPHYVTDVKGWCRRRRSWSNKSGPGKFPSPKPGSRQAARKTVTTSTQSPVGSG